MRRFYHISLFVLFLFILVLTSSSELNKRFAVRAIADAWKCYCEGDRSLYEKFPYRTILEEEMHFTYAFLHPDLIRIDVDTEFSSVYSVHFRAENKWQALYYASLTNDWTGELWSGGLFVNEECIEECDGGLCWITDAVCVEEESPGHWIAKIALTIK